MSSRINISRIECSKDRRRKVCNIMEEQIKKMRNEDHMTFASIAKTLKLSENTVYSTIYPDRKRRIIEGVKKINKIRYHNDPEFRKKQIQTVLENNRKRWQNDPEFRKQKMEYHNQYMKNHPEKAVEYKKRREEKMLQKKLQEKEIKND